MLEDSPRMLSAEEQEAETRRQSARADMAEARIQKLEAAAYKLCAVGWHSFACQSALEREGDGLCSCGLNRARNAMRQVLAQPAAPEAKEEPHG